MSRQRRNRAPIAQKSPSKSPRELVAEEDRLNAERSAACAAEVAEVLKKHNCMFGVKGEYFLGEIKSQVMYIPLPPAQPEKS